jgi:head-tail adaptor
MRAGLLMERINFLRLEKVKTDTGSEYNTYVPEHSCRARVTYAGGDRENENGDIFYSHHIHFEIRRGLEFDELYRIEWEGRQYRILCIEQNKHNQSTKIITELVND